MTEKQFLKKTGLTEDQFYGRVKIQGSLNLDHLNSIPEGHTKSQKKLLEIYQKHPNLTLNNKGYEEIDSNKVTQEDKEAVQKVEEILKERVEGFHRFQNFKDSSGKVVIRCQANYNHNTREPTFIGVIYIGLNDLK